VTEIAEVHRANGAYSVQTTVGGSVILTSPDKPSGDRL
jgi:hypothetical protein